jgi:long-chain acyl-CoA synthetase
VNSYSTLLAYAKEKAEELVKQPTVPIDARGHYIREEAKLLVAADVENVSGTRTASHDMVDMVVNNWAAISRGVPAGKILKHDRTLWARSNKEFLMGVYADLMADWLISNQLLDGDVLELGSGVGATSDQLTDKLNGTLTRSDLTDLNVDGPGKFVSWNFNEPTPDEFKEQFDVVFATNALHCADNKTKTLAYIAECVRPGGLVALSEGAPFTQPGIPWALNYVYGLFDGWWDVSGFWEPSSWERAFHVAGYVNFQHAPLTIDDHFLGGLYVTKKPWPKAKSK